MKQVMIVAVCLLAPAPAGCFSFVIPQVPFDREAYGMSFPDRVVEPSRETPFIVAVDGLLGSAMRTRIIGFVAARLDADFIVAPTGGWPKVMGPIRDAYMQGFPIVIVSYSLGNNDIIEDVLPILDSLGVPVSVWVILDGQYQTDYAIFPAARSGPIPANVGMVVNIISHGPFNGRELVDGDFVDAATPRFNIFADANHVGLISASIAASVLGFLD